MSSKTFRTSDSHDVGSRRTRKAEAHVANERAPKAADEISKESGAGVQFQHEGGQVGETIRLKRLNSSHVSGGDDTAHLLPSAAVTTIDTTTTTTSTTTNETSVASVPNDSAVSASSDEKQMPGTFMGEGLLHFITAGMPRK